MRVPRLVKSYINTYYAFQGRAAQGLPTQPKWKEVCLRAIDRACTRHGIGLTAAAGTFFLSKGKQTLQVNTPFFLDPYDRDRQ